VLVALLVITKTMNSIGIMLLRMEYLLSREFELVKEKEEIKKKIAEKQSEADQRYAQRHGAADDPLLRIPYMMKKDKK
jgi:hypothetical protein